MSRLMKRPVTTCSIGFEEKEFDELDTHGMSPIYFTRNIMKRPSGPAL